MKRSVGRKIYSNNGRNLVYQFFQESDCQEILRKNQLDRKETIKP